jgi:RNA polymerase sigma-70 factor, ECF subfamily
MEAAARTEEAIKEAFAKGDYARAATETLKEYGPEVFGLLVALHRDRDEASDAFGDFTERLWTSLPAFAWKCSMRTWVYVIARSASTDLRRKAGRRNKRDVPLSNAPEVSRVAAQVRTRTLTLLRTENKTALMELRESLPEDDRMLLVLRVDRGLAWNELALVFVDAAEAADPEAVKRESARLRKRFQLVKERLLEMGRERGLAPR